VPSCDGSKNKPPAPFDALQVEPGLEATNGKLQLVIKCEKMVRIVEFDVPIMTRYGKVGVTKKWARVYEYVFDEGQMRALSEARELASKSGLILEVTDLSRQSALRRMTRQGLSRRMTRQGLSRRMTRQGLSRISLAARIGTGSRQSSKTTPMGTQAKRGTVISKAARP